MDASAVCEPRELVEHLRQCGIKPVKLLRELIHGGGHRRLKLGQLPGWRQIEELAIREKKFRGGGSRYQLLRTGIGGEENQEEKDSNQENLRRIWGRSRSEFGFLIP